MSERSGGREQSEQSGASERVSGASERANGQASGPVLTSQFLAFLTHRQGPQPAAENPQGRGNGCMDVQMDGPGLAFDRPWMASERPKLASKRFGLASKRPGLASESPKLASKRPEPLKGLGWSLRDLG